MKERETSQLSNDLNTRINTNNAFGNKDLTAWLLEKLNLRENTRLLDLGCGTGKQLLACAATIKTPNQCTGLDISPDSIKKAQEDAKKQNLNVDLRAISYDNLEEAKLEGKFDVITSIYAIYYSKNIQKLLQEAKKLLAPGGRFVVMGPYADNNKKWFDFINQFMTLPENVLKSTTTFMYDEIIPFVCEQFSEVKCVRFENELCIPSLDDLRNYWKSNIYYKDEYNDAFEKLAKEHFEKNKAFYYSKVALYVEATL